jgi:hypothetical protein
MPRLITIDKTVIDQINAGNLAVAQFFERLPSGSRLRMSAECFSQLNAAEQRLVTDMGVDHPNADRNYVDFLRYRADSRMQYVEKMDPEAFRAIAPEHEATIAVAFGSELMTFDRRLAETYGRITARLIDRVVPEMGGIAAVSRPTNYNTGRQMMNLKPLNISPAGAVLPTPSVTQANPANGPRTSGGSRTTQNITAEVGDKLEAPQEYGPSAGGDAKFQAATVALEGFNFLLQKINGAIQNRRFVAERDRKMPGIQQKLDDDPQLGAMLFVLYSKDKGDIESAIDSATVFQSIEVAYGFTPDDALREYKNADPRMTGPADIGDKIWIKPKAPLDIGRFKLPFGTTAAGLATFVPGKEKLVRVKFGGITGFDDKFHSRETLSVPAGTTPRFYYLWPPKEIRYYNLGRIRTVDVDTTISDEADESVASLGIARKTYKGIPVVKLDSFINPSTWFSGGATAAMVWPADNRTANLFQTTMATQDNLDLLAGQGIGMMRWIRPEFIRVLKDPI